MYKLPALLMLCSTQIIAAPSVEMTGGRYLISGLDGYYLSDHTAKAAAINEAFRCKCVVTISQPDIKVRSFYVKNSALVSWDRPTQREDGTPLTLDEISGFEITMISASETITVQVGNILSHNFTELTPGFYTFTVKTIDSSGAFSDQSLAVSKTILDKST